MIVVCVGHFPNDTELHEVTFEIDDRLADIILGICDEETANTVFNEIREHVIPTFYLADVGIIFLNRIESLLHFPYVPAPKN